MNEDEHELKEDEDEVDELFNWMADTFSSGGSAPIDYNITLQNGTITTVSDGTTTVSLT